MKTSRCSFFLRLSLTACSLIAFTSVGRADIVAAPVFSFATGTYPTPQSVSISSSTPGAAIHYTTDGTTPSDTVGIPYTGPITVSGTTTIWAVAYASGLTNSAVSTATYTIQAAAPTFSPRGPNPILVFTPPLTVTISTTTSGASIRYTTDLTTPSDTAGTLYTGPITLNAITTIKAVAYASGLANSWVVMAVYEPRAVAPAFNPPGGTYTSAQSVTLSSTTPGASIRYTTDGSAPSDTAGTLYSGPFTVSASTTVKAVAFESGWAKSLLATATYVITPPVAAPTFSPASGTYSSGQTVTITTATPGASIRYTTNGATPSETAGTPYAGPIAVNTTTTIHAIAYKSGLADSPVTSATYVISLPVAAPTFNPASGTYSSRQTVTIASATSGASLRYTVDGSTPSEAAGTLYAGPLAVSATTSIKAIAFESGMTDSAVTSATYTISPPTIAGVSPTTGAAGVQVTIAGSGFGSAQGTGAVWLGTAPGVVVSWSGTQIVAAVASNATSGSARVQQGGAWSNAVPFNVNTATITAVTPASGVPGTQVTIAGSSFGAVQGNGQVWLGTANAVVQSWSDTQIVALVASGSASGNALVLQSGVMSNPVPFAVNTLHLTSVSPNSGAAGTSVTFTGAGFGYSQGSGVAWLGSTAGQVVSWSDTQVVATVTLSALTGVARIQQNGVWSNAVAFTVPAANGMTLMPSMLNLLVGDTHAIQAVNGAGQPVTGLTWTSSDPTVVSLSSDDPPLLTALAAGHVTITAGTASADVTVSDPAALPDGVPPIGTVLWSRPGDVLWFAPAVPSPNSVVDSFAYQNGAYQAITSDGTTAWTADIDYTSASGAWADFQGGLVVVQNIDGPPDPISIIRFDATGQRTSAVTIDQQPEKEATMVQSELAVHTDGTVFAVVQTYHLCPPLWCYPYHVTFSVIGIDPSGGEKFTVPVEGADDLAVWPGGAIVAGDGYAYVPYVVVHRDRSGVEELKLLRISSAGAYDDIPIQTINGGHVGSFGMITDADSGILLTFSVRYASQGVTPQVTSVPQAPRVTHGPRPPASAASARARRLARPAPHDDPAEQVIPFMVLTTGAGASVMGAPGGMPVTPHLQTQDGSFVGVADTGDGTQSMIYFDRSGGVRWAVPGYTPLIATGDGGVIATGDGVSATVFDQNGAAVGQMAALPTQSWRGNVYQLGSVDRMATPPLLLAQSLWAYQGGSPSGNNSAGRPWYFKLIWENNCSTSPQPCGFTLYPANPVYNDSLYVDATSQAGTIKSAALSALKKAFDKYPVTVSEGRSDKPTGDNRAWVDDGSSSNAGTDRCGGTYEWNQHDSMIWYRMNMEQAQWALPLALTTLQDVQRALTSLYLMTAIGTGIGNNAAHEIGHQFFGRVGAGMDDNSVNTYNGQGCSGETAEWVYGSGVIGWEGITANAWKSTLSGGWHKQ